MITLLPTERSILSLKSPLIKARSIDHFLIGEVVLMMPRISSIDGVSTLFYQARDQHRSDTCFIPCCKSTAYFPGSVSVYFPTGFSFSLM